MKKPRIDTERSIDAAIERARGDGRTNSRADAEILLAARGEHLDSLLEVASLLRDTGLANEGRERQITYSKKVFLPITKLCRDRCHYCVFVETPNRLLANKEPLFMEPDDILRVARQGASLGCKEALFTLGDRPEDRWPAAQDWLDRHHYTSTLHYVKEMAQLVLEETGLLPHLNPGVMSWAELQRLRPVAPSMGMMLETTSVRLWAEKGNPHYGSPDKEPSLRLRVLEDAGRSRIPFTTGILVGIGETDAERADALFEIRDVHHRYGHIQETIVQNFRAKDRTAMQRNSDVSTQEYAATIAVARLVMGPNARIQAPPNLTDAAGLDLLVRAGVDDWGGVSPLTPDHVNPERPWPALDELARLTRRLGFELRERLTAQPAYVNDAGTWIDPRLHGHVSVLADGSSGLANAQAVVRPLKWTSSTLTHARGPRSTSNLDSLLWAAADDPAGLTDSEYAQLLGADGPALEALCGLADEVRRETVGEEVTYVANRNLDSSLYAPEGETAPGILSPSRIGELVEEAHSLGATEICVQGPLHADLPGSAYLDLVRLVKSVRSDMHVHAYRPGEVVDGAARNGMTVREFLLELKNAGVDTVPGSGARILDDVIRARLSNGTDMSVSDWAEAITTAHSVGLRSTATMVYGHIESHLQQIAHMRLLASIQDQTGGFTEFIAMPFLPHEAPGLLDSRPGPSLRETRAVHAVARLLFHRRIDNIQVAWTKTGLTTGQVLLGGGANDFGGLLLDGALWPEAGAEAHRSLNSAEVARLAGEIGRPIRQRTTDYLRPFQAPLHAPRG